MEAPTKMENKKNIECSIMDEVREMRRKISAEFGNDLNQLVAYYQELENEMRESGKYKFADLPNEEPKSEEVNCSEMVDRLHNKN